MCRMLLLLRIWIPESSSPYLPSAKQSNKCVLISCFCICSRCKCPGAGSSSSSSREGLVVEVVAIIIVIIVLVQAFPKYLILLTIYGSLFFFFFRLFFSGKEDIYNIGGYD